MRHQTGAARRTLLVPGALVAAALLLCACSGPTLIKTPIGLRADESYVERVPPEQRVAEARILYATDRAASRSSNPARRYTAERATTLTLGEATVRFGAPGADFDTIARRTIEQEKVKLRLEAVEEFGVLPSTVPLAQREVLTLENGADRFVQEINDRLAASDEKVVTVFVHGFNTAFPWAVRMSASLWHMMDRQGAVITYSWPSHDSPFFYPQDRESGALTARALREMLFLIAERTDAVRINLLTYSAGAPTLMATLYQIRLIYADEPPERIQRATKIGEVVFAGADLDPDVLRISGMDRFQDVAERVTIYTSRKDSGVGLSSFFYFKGERLGKVEQTLTEEERKGLLDYAEFNLIDVTLAQSKAGRGDFWAHGYWYGNPWVSNDLTTLLLTSADPQDRGLIRTDDDGVWRFPKDYPQRIMGR